MVAGSGAAGMTAALTAAHLGLSALVIEKAGSFGGSTARSGGGIWAPAGPQVIGGELFVLPLLSVPIGHVPAKQRKDETEPENAGRP